MVFEFGPLWLVAAAVPTVVFGPYTAAMTSTLGLGGLLAGRVKLDRPLVATGAAVAMSACGLALAVGTAAPLLIAAQVVLLVLLVTIGIHLSRLLHDLVPSQQRSGVSSGIGTLSWLTFLPCSLLFGALSTGAGHPSGGLDHHRAGRDLGRDPDPDRATSAGAPTEGNLGHTRGVNRSEPYERAERHDLDVRTKPRRPQVAPTCRDRTRGCMGRHFLRAAAQGRAESALGAVASLAGRRRREEVRIQPRAQPDPPWLFSPHF